MKPIFQTILLLLAFSTISCVQDAPIKVACVGDSITEGAGLKRQSETSFPFVLGDILGPEYSVMNCGRSGTTALKKSNFTYWKCKEIKNTLVYNPDIIVIKLGTNDTKASNWNEENYELDYQALIDTFNTIVPQPKIYLCLPVPAFKFKFNICDSTLVNGVIPALKRLASKNNLPIIDLHTAMQDYGSLYRDGIHPNEEGARLIAEYIAEELQK